jgi:hypothetical protein
VVIQFYESIGQSPLSPSSLSPIGVRLRLPFLIVYTVQSDGDLHFVEAVQTFADAKGLVREIGELWPGEYIIDNEETESEYSLILGTRRGTNWS